MTAGVHIPRCRKTGYTDLGSIPVRQVYCGEMKNAPRDTKELPIARRTYRESAKVLILRVHVSAVFGEGRLVTIKVAAAQHTPLTNPDTRTPQPKLRLPKRRWSIIGYTTPPEDE